MTVLLYILSTQAFIIRTFLLLLLNLEYEFFCELFANVFTCMSMDLRNDVGP